MKDFNKFVILIYLYIFELSLDLVTNKCYQKLENKDKYKFNIILLLHHVISVFAQFGWIFNNKKILILYIIQNSIILLHWMTNKGKCFITVIINKLCKQDYQNKYISFDDLPKKLGIKFLSPLLIIGGIFIAIYKLVCHKDC